MIDKKVYYRSSNFSSMNKVTYTFVLVALILTTTLVDGIPQTRRKKGALTQKRVKSKYYQSSPKRLYQLGQYQNYPYKQEREESKYHQLKPKQSYASSQVQKYPYKRKPAQQEMRKFRVEDILPKKRYPMKKFSRGRYSRMTSKMMTLTDDRVVCMKDGVEIAVIPSASILHFMMEKYTDQLKFVIKFDKELVALFVMLENADFGKVNFTQNLLITEFVELDAAMREKFIPDAPPLSTPAFDDDEAPEFQDQDYDGNVTSDEVSSYETYDVDNKDANEDEEKIPETLLGAL